MLPIRWKPVSIRVCRACALAFALSSFAGCVTTESSESTATLAPLGPPDNTIAPSTTTTAVTTTTIAVASLEPVPSTAAPAVDAPGAVATTIDVPTSTTSVAGGQVYTVVASDTMYRIGRQFGVSAQAIADYNNWSDGVTHPIHPGDLVRIPPAGASVPPAATSPVTAAPTTTVASGGTYTVVAGDYLSVIATKTGTTVNGIVAANGWSDGANHLIRPGDVIKLPVKSG